MTGAPHRQTKPFANGQAAERSNSAPTLSIIIPCFNEGKILADTYQQLRAYLEQGAWHGTLPNTWEIIFVNDGSSDDTDVVVTRLQAHDRRVRLCSYRHNAGQGQALQTGFADARGEWVFCVDADLDYGPEHIERFLKQALQQDADIVVGSPYMPGGQALHVPRIRRWMSRVANWYFARIFNIGIRTFTGIARLYRRAALNRLMLTSRDKDVLPEIIIKAHALGMKITESPATLCWKPEVQKTRGRGAGILSTGRKALRHFLWGVVENPFFFFSLPIVLSVVFLAWFSFAVLYLFCRDFTATGRGTLADVTETFSMLVHENPQTFLCLTLFFFSTMILSCIGLIIYQNKIKKDHDFLYFTFLSDRLHQRGHGLDS